MPRHLSLAQLYLDISDVIIVAVKESGQRLRGTLDNMLEGCQIIDRGFHYAYLNDAAARHGEEG